jgi:hypothetical protein
MPSFIVPDAVQPVLAVRSDATKRALLKTKVDSLLSASDRTALRAGRVLDVFGLAVTVRAALPAGLLAADFDGVDIQAIVNELLGV